MRLRSICPEPCRRAAAALLLLVITGCGQAPTQAAVEYRPEEAGTVDHALCLLGFTGVELSEVSTGHQLVDLSLNGREATFVVDTGANVSVLHAPFADDFGLSDDRAARGGQARLVRIDSLQLGGVAIRQNRIVLADLSQVVSALGRMSDRPVSGIIGQDVLGEHRAVIDVPRSILYLIEADEDPTPVPAERCRRGEEPVETGDAGQAGNRSESR